MRKKQEKFTGKVRLKKGDEVVVLAGKDKGKRGKIVEVEPDKGYVYVEGLNIQVRHQRQRQRSRSMPQTQTGRIERPGPLHCSKVMLIDPHNGKPSRIGIGVTPDGRRGRISKKSGDFIDDV